MSRYASSLINLVLAGVIALTSATLFQERGRGRDQAGRIVLCTGTGPISVAVDKDGQPIGEAHVCPDCAIAAFGWLPDGDETIAWEARRIVVEYEQIGRTQPHLFGARPRARGPPIA